MAGVTLQPKGVRDWHRVDAQSVPPLPLFNRAVHLTMMRPTERHREFITDFEAECPGLRKAQMVGVARLAPANNTRLCRDILTMPLVAQSAGLGRHGVVFEIDGLCRGQGRGSCCYGALRNRFGLQRRLRARIFAPTLR